MPLSLRRQPNFLNLSKPTSPLVILDSSASDSVSPRLSWCLSCDLCVLWVLTLESGLKPSSPGFSWASQLSLLARPRGSQNQAPGSAFHQGYPLDLRATAWWDLTTQATPGPKASAGSIMTLPPAANPSNTEVSLHWSQKLGRDAEFAAQTSHDVNRWISRLQSGLSTSCSFPT